MSDVFVSYKAEDRKRVETLVSALEANGFSVWWDPHISGGEGWRDAIQNQLEHAKCVIVVWSKRSVGPHGNFVRDEASRAQRRHIYLPVRIDEVEPPLGFGEIQTIPLTGWTGDQSDPRLQHLLNAVRAIIAGDLRPHFDHSEDSLVSRRAIIAGSAFAAVALGTGGWILLKHGLAKPSKSIAVLPFANLSGDPSQAYFSDGLAEELRTALSRIPDLKVMARTSSEKVRDDDIQTAARKLNVGNILTGSVRRSPSTIRVSAQLVDGNNGLERWSEAYDRQVGDALSIQAEIAERVAGALSIQLGQGVRTALTAGGTTNAEAHDLVLKVNRDSDFDSLAGETRRLALLNAALVLDPNYADAYARKAGVLNEKTAFHPERAEDFVSGLNEAVANANRAIAIALQLALGYAARGSVLRNQFKWKAALASYKQANAVSGNSVDAIHGEAALLGRLGRFGPALRLNAIEVSLDPFNPSAHLWRSVFFYYARRYKEAEASVRRSLEIAPGGENARTVLGNTMLAQGKLAEAEL